ncbi:hypothetical protein ACJX0J_027455, partial [Zea mays]
VTLIKEEMMQEKIAQGKAQGPNHATFQKKCHAEPINNGQLILQFPDLPELDMGFVALIKKRFFLFTEGTTMEDNLMQANHLLEEVNRKFIHCFGYIHPSFPPQLEGDFFAEIPRILSPNMWFLVIHLKEIGYSKGHLEQENEFTRGNCLKKLGLKPNLF